LSLDAFKQKVLNYVNWDGPNWEPWSGADQGFL